MAGIIGFRARAVIGAGVEPAAQPVGGDDSTHPPMKAREPPRTVCFVRFRDIAPPGHEGPPRGLRALGFAALAVVLGTPFITDPKPGLDGDGPFVALAIVLMASGMALAMRRQEWFPAARFIGLCLVGPAVLLFAAFQPDSAGYAGVYFVVVLAAMRLKRDAALLVCGVTVGGLVVITLFHEDGAGNAIRLLFSVAPWFL